MNGPILRIAILLLMVSTTSFAQKTEPVPACKQSTFAAFKPLPKLEYDCPQNLTESDDKMLQLPERLAAMGKVVRQLEAFTNAAWWQANVDDLNACKVHGRAGELTGEEKQEWKGQDYSFDLLGNHQMRLALITDPCYQNGYNRPCCCSIIKTEKFLCRNSLTAISPALIIPSGSILLV